MSRHQKKPPLRVEKYSSILFLLAVDIAELGTLFPGIGNLSDYLRKLHLCGK